MNDRGILHSDLFWGAVLIGLGSISIVYKPFEKIDAAISDAGDKALTAGLIVTAVMVIIAAFYARPALKALMLVWIVTP